MLLRLASSGRDVMSYRIGSERNVLLNHPDHAQHVLGSNRDNYSKNTGANRYFKAEVADGILTADGERWRRQRTLLTPAFRDRQRLVATAARSHCHAGREVRLARRHRPRGESVRCDRRGDPLDYHPRPVRNGPQLFIEHCTALGRVLDDTNSLLPGADAGVGPRDALYRQIRNAVSASATEVTARPCRR